MNIDKCKLKILFILLLYIYIYFIMLFHLLFVYPMSLFEFLKPYIYFTNEINYILLYLFFRYIYILGIISLGDIYNAGNLVSFPSKPIARGEILILISTAPGWIQSVLKQLRTFVSARTKVDHVTRSLPSRMLIHVLFLDIAIKVRRAVSNDVALPPLLPMRNLELTRTETSKR